MNTKSLLLSLSFVCLILTSQAQYIGEGYTIEGQPIDQFLLPGSIEIPGIYAGDQSAVEVYFNTVFKEKKDFNFFKGQLHFKDGRVLDRELSFHKTTPTTLKHEKTGFAMYKPRTNPNNYGGASTYNTLPKENKHVKLDCSLQEMYYGITRNIYLDSLEKFIILEDTFQILQKSELDPSKTNSKRSYVFKKNISSERYDWYFNANEGNENQFVLYDRKDYVWHDFFLINNTEFVERLITLFPSNPHLKHYLENVAELIEIKGMEQVHSIMNIVRYFEKFNAGEHVYFNESYEEVEADQPYTTYIKIDSIENGLWYLSYYNNKDHIIKSGSYNALNESGKEGLHTWHHPNGNISLTVTFNKSGQPEGYFTQYDPKGNPLFEYEILEYSFFGTQKKKNYVAYYDNGYRQEMPPNKTIFVLPSAYVENRMMTYTWEYNKLVSLKYYSETQDNDIYLLPERQVNFKVKEKLDYPIDLNNIKGTSIIYRFTVDAKGKLIKKELLNEPDTTLLAHCEEWLSSKASLSFKPAKFKEQPVSSEFIFKINYSPVDYINELKLYYHYQFDNMHPGFNPPMPAIYRN